MLLAADRGQHRAARTRRAQWVDKPNYFDVTVWGQQGENCAQYLAKGRPVAVDGRLEWREWEAQDGSKRQAVDIVADSVQFLGGRQDAEGAAYVPAGATGAGAAAETTSRPRPPTTTSRSSVPNDRNPLAQLEHDR